MKTYLVDASFVVKSILKEDAGVEDRLKALLRKSQKTEIELISTKLLFVEVANALRFGIKDRVECSRLLRDFFLLPIKTVVLSKGQINKALEISYGLGTTVYDTSYHILAKAKGGLFLTCDKEYYEKAKQLGDIEFVK